ncbi:MAG: PD-(D/E)XK nuclease family protein, partial [Clostridiales bacterium]|nr:PD-(D/E)XK nuclease family protein [Clostridiales bacterium]
NSITVGLVSGTGGGDDHIFAYTSESLKRFLKRMRRMYPGIPVSVDKYEDDESGTDPGIRFIERNVFALGKSLKDIPDLSSVSVYYASDTYIECLYTAQTLIWWHRDGIAWHDMAVAVCGDSPVASLLPLVLSSAKIPYTDRTGISMLLSEYAQFFIATLRSIRSGFKQEEILKLIKSEFVPLNGDEMMDLENYVRQYGIDRGRWQKQFDAEDDRTERLEEARLRLIEPLAALRKRLSAKSCTGRAAAEAIYEYMVAAGAYDKLLTRERELIDAGMLNAADRNRQVWTAVNEMLDQLALFAGDDHLSAEELCLMLESSISARMIKSLPQIAESVTVSSPNMFFSSGVRAAAVIGMQERSSTPSAALLTPSECTLLLRSAGEDDITASIGVTKREAAAKAKQEINRAIASATERIMFSCSARQPNGKALIPSAEFREISELVYSQHPENVRGGLSNDDLGPFTPQFAMERLASMLRSAEKEEDSFLTSDDPVSICWRDSLAFLYGNGSWHDKTSAVLDSLHVTVSKGGIPSNLATLLYGRDRLSVSAVETAGICPFRAFMEYALRVKERKDFVFETDSEGTFSHEVLRYFFERASALPVYPALSDSDISSLLDSVIEEQTKPWYNGPLGRNVSGRFRWKEIVDYVRFTVGSLARAIRTTPHFTPIGMEVGFGRSHTESHPHFPAVELDLGDGRKAELNGSIDRVDTVILDDGRKAAMLYDFKSSVKEVRGEAL